MVGIVVYSIAAVDAVPVAAAVADMKSGRV